MGMSWPGPGDVGSSLATAGSRPCGHGQLYPLPDPHFPMSSGTSSKGSKDCHKATGGLFVRRVLWVPWAWKRGSLLLLLVATFALKENKASIVPPSSQNTLYSPASLQGKKPQLLSFLQETSLSS